MYNQQLQHDIALWVIRLNCDDPEERAKVQLEFAEWQQLHPECIEHIEEMQSFAQNIQQLSNQHRISAHTVERSYSAVKKNQQSIHKLFQGAVLTCTALAVTALLYKTIPLDYYLADYRTNTGQMQNYTLSDGSKITLGAKSAIKVNFTANQRNIELVSGEIYVDVARDATRPLIVHTQQADFKALGTRFIVDQAQAQSSIAMLHSKVQISSNLNQNQPLANSSKVVSMGQQVIVNQQGIQAAQSIDPSLIAQAWQQQLIIAENLPLSELLHKLQQHHDNYIIFDQDKLSQIKVNGVINTKQDLSLTLKLIKSQHPEIDFVQIGKYVTYAKVKS